MGLAEDEAFMRHAIRASREALQMGNFPFGAALVKNGVLEHVAGNDAVTTNDVTGHAEVALVREAAKLKGPAVLVGATVYASGEPCAMCTGAMFWAGVSRIVFAATTPDIMEILGGATLPLRTANVVAGANPAVLVEGPILRDEALAVLHEASRLLVRP
jgi:tRNA(Arg) A34 adenosine deaminase TadA